MFKVKAGRAALLEDAGSRKWLNKASFLGEEIRNKLERRYESGRLSFFLKGALIYMERYVGKQDSSL